MEAKPDIFRKQARLRHSRAEEHTEASEPDQRELDLRLSYEPQVGRLEGLRVEVEYVDLHQRDSGPSDDLTQFRTIVNYSLPLL